MTPARRRRSRSPRRSTPRPGRGLARPASGPAWSPSRSPTSPTHPVRFTLSGPTDAATPRSQPGRPASLKLDLRQGSYQATAGGQRGPSRRSTVGPERTELAEPAAAALALQLDSSAAAISDSMRSSFARPPRPSRRAGRGPCRSSSVIAGQRRADRLGLLQRSRPPPRPRRGRRRRRPGGRPSRAISPRARRAGRRSRAPARRAPPGRPRRSACCPRTRCSCSRPGGTRSSPATTSTANAGGALPPCPR